MKRIINGRKYDTSTATVIYSHEAQIPCDDAHYFKETLYRKKNGEFFGVGVGGKLSPYGMLGEHQVLFPLPEEKIKVCLESLLTVEEYEAIFGTVEE